MIFTGEYWIIYQTVLKFISRAIQSVQYQRRRNVLREIDGSKQPAKF